MIRYFFKLFYKKNSFQKNTKKLKRGTNQEVKDDDRVFNYFDLSLNGFINN